MTVFDAIQGHASSEIKVTITDGSMNTGLAVIPGEDTHNCRC
jgi:hypothetical protein